MMYVGAWPQLFRSRAGRAAKPRQLHETLFNCRYVRMHAATCVGGAGRGGTVLPSAYHLQVGTRGGRGGGGGDRITETRGGGG